MTLRKSVFDYLKPSDDDLATMNTVRALFKDFTAHLYRLLPDGDDKDFVMRTLRTAAMWANVSITRDDNGAPRTVQKEIW